MLTIPALKMSEVERNRRILLAIRAGRLRSWYNARPLALCPAYWRLVIERIRSIKRKDVEQREYDQEFTNTL